MAKITKDWNWLGSEGERGTYRIFTRKRQGFGGPMQASQWRFELHEKRSFDHLSDRLSGNLFYGREWVVSSQEFLQYRPQRRSTFMAEDWLNRQEPLIQQKSGCKVHNQNVNTASITVVKIWLQEVLKREVLCGDRGFLGVSYPKVLNRFWWNFVWT
jgi:hypothetical protein